MRKIVQDYLEKPNAKLLAAMTSEEQRYIDNQNPKKEKAPKAPKPKEE